MLDGWRVAAQVLAPDRAAEVADALLACEREIWDRTTTTLRSATTAEVLKNAAAVVGLPVDELLHDDAIEAYLDHWAPATYPRHDARIVLGDLRDRGLRLGLLSNTHWPRHWHEEALSRDGLLDLFDARVYTSDLEHVKPHPEAFGALLAELDLDPLAAVFVGDRLWDDIAGAKQLGMRTIWVRNTVVPSYDVEPDAVVDELGEVVGVVDTWLVPAAAG